MLKQSLWFAVLSCLLGTLFTNVAGAQTSSAPETCQHAASAVVLAICTDANNRSHPTQQRSPNQRELDRVLAACGQSRAETALRSALDEQARTCHAIPSGSPDAVTVVHRGQADCRRGAVPTSNGLDCTCPDRVQSGGQLLDGSEAHAITLRRHLVHGTSVRSIRVRREGDHTVREVYEHIVAYCVLQSTDAASMDEELNSLVHRSVVEDIQAAIRSLNQRVDAVCAHPVGPNGEISHDCVDFNTWLMSKLRDGTARMDDMQLEIDVIDGRVREIIEIQRANGLTRTSNHEGRIRNLESIFAGFGVRLGLGLHLVYPTQGQLFYGAALRAGLDYRVNQSALGVYIDGGLGGGQTAELGAAWSGEVSVGLRVMASDWFSFSFGPVVRNLWVSWDEPRLPVGNDNRLWMVGGRLQANFHLNRYFLIALGLDVGYGEQTVLRSNIASRQGGAILAPFVALEIPIVNPFAPRPAASTVTTTSSTTSTSSEVRPAD